MESKVILTVNEIVLSQRNRGRVSLVEEENSEPNGKAPFDLWDTDLTLMADDGALKPGDRIEVTLRKL